MRSEHMRLHSLGSLWVAFFRAALATELLSADQGCHEEKRSQGQAPCPLSYAFPGTAPWALVEISGLFAPASLGLLQNPTCSHLCSSWEPPAQAERTPSTCCGDFLLPALPRLLLSCQCTFNIILSHIICVFMNHEYFFKKDRYT